MPQTGRLKPQKYISISSGSWKSKIKILSDAVSGESCLPASQMAVLLCLQVFTWWRERFLPSLTCLQSFWIMATLYDLTTSPPKDCISAAAAKSLQWCLTLCNPIDGSPPGSPVPGILQARTLEWLATSFSNAWKWKVKVKSLSRVRLLATPWTAAYQVPPSMGFSRQEYWSGVPSPSPIVSLDTIKVEFRVSTYKFGGDKIQSMAGRYFTWLWMRNFMTAWMHAQSLQSCPTLCDPMDCSPSGYSVHENLRASILECVATPSSKGSSRLRDRT